MLSVQVVQKGAWEVLGSRPQAHRLALRMFFNSYGFRV